MVKVSMYRKTEYENAFTELDMLTELERRGCILEYGKFTKCGYKYLTTAIARVSFITFRRTDENSESFIQPYTHNSQPVRKRDKVLSHRIKFL